MATAAKLVTDLTVVLRGMRSHEGLITSHLARAADDDVAGRLREAEARERAVAGRVARALHGLGAPTPRTRPSWLPSPTSVVASAATRAQPLGEALVVEATVVRMLADRSRVVRGLAIAVDRSTVVDVATEVADLYDGYADWLVQTAAALVVDEDAADLVPTTPQRVAGRVKDVVGAPARVYGRLADRSAAGIGRATGLVRDLVGLGSDAIATVAEVTTAAVTDTTDAVEHAVRPVRAADLPVARYDDHTAAEAIRAVRELDTVEDVSTVLAYEALHKDRSTVLAAGDKRADQLASAGT